MALGASLVAFVTVIACADRFQRERDDMPVFGVDNTGLILAIFDHGGMISSGNDGLRAAVWDDGSYVLSARHTEPGVAMRCGKLDKEDLARFFEFLNCNALATKADIQFGVSDIANTSLSFRSESAAHSFGLTGGWPDCPIALWEGSKSASLKLAKSEWQAALCRLWNHPTAPYPRRSVGPNKIPTAVRPSEADLAQLTATREAGVSNRQLSDRN